MKNQLTIIRSVSLTMVLIVLSGSIVLGQQPEISRLRAITVDVPDGWSATINASSPLTEAVSYKSGERFVVIIPQASVSSFQSDAGGRAFLNIQIEQRGEDVAISFKLRPGGSARLNQRAAGLEVSFSLPDMAALAPAAGNPDSEARTTLPPSKINSALPSSTTTTPALTSNAVTTPALPLPQGATPTLTQLLGFIPGATKDLKADVSNIDLSVPESPAFTVLGLTPNAIVRPGTPRELATSLLNGLDKNGNFQSGLAIDTAPYMLFNGKNITLQDYNDYYLTRLLSRTQFSMAATRGATKEDTGTRLALGINLTIWDKGDARVYHPKRGPDGDVLTCFRENIKPPDAPSSAMPSQAEIEAINTRAKIMNDRAADICRDKVRKANWNRTSWIVAYAPSWISRNGQTSNFNWNGGAFWTSFAYGFDGIPSLNKIGQLILHARYRSKEQVVDPARPGQFISQNSTLFGTRFRAGNPNFAFNVEAAYVRNQPFGRASITSNRLAFGAEVRISENLYFVVTGGNGPEDASKSKKGFFMSSFKYGFNKKSQLNPQP